MPRELATPIQHFTRHLAECPPEFLGEPRIGKEGTGVYTPALVYDVLEHLGNEPTLDDLDGLRGRKQQHRTPEHRNFLKLVQVTSWLLYHPEFGEQEVTTKQVLGFLHGQIKRRAELVNAELFVSDPDRREELVRLCLFELQLLPEGESKNFFRDRLNALDSVERQRVLEATREKLRRAEELKKKLAEQQAREAASRYTRE